MLTPRDYRPRLDGQGALDLERRVRLRAVENMHDDPNFDAQFPASNFEERVYTDTAPTNFTKGLYHDLMGKALRPDYEALVKGLREPPEPGNMGPFEIPAQTSVPADRFLFEIVDPGSGALTQPDQRKWESPLAGLNADLQGPAPAAIGQPPAPCVGSDELTAELAEVYAMALMRDVSFKDMEDPNATFLVAGQAISVQQIIDELNKLTWFDYTAPAISVDAGQPGERAIHQQEDRRRAARFAPGEQILTVRSLFRGSAPGAKVGPYISQFMLLGSRSLGADTGYVAFGAQRIDQRLQPDMAHLDYMTEFLEWWDVQNGAGFKNVASTEPPRFLTIVRDMASYVHVDQLYQAYFNACLILADASLSPDHGLPNASEPERIGFATWGIPHLLALLAEVSSRALRAVRRQKFQIHRRARPEALAAKLTLVANGHGGAVGQARPYFERMLEDLQTNTPNLMAWVEARNSENNTRPSTDRGLHPTAEAGQVTPPSLAKNYLLPMAFAEGSPMHPAYGAGHATVAGACVTILKAFFQTVDGNGRPVPWSTLNLPDDRVGDGANLISSSAGVVETITGELDKLAANISIGRNMAGVHYYTDYYESLRMGERIATQILHQNMLTSPEPTSMRFFDFDGRLVTIRARPFRDIRFPDAIETAAHIEIMDPTSMSSVPAADWWGENLNHAQSGI